MQVEFPDNVTTLNEKAWYMHNFCGMTFGEIGTVLNYSAAGAHKLVISPYQRKSRAKIYEMHQDYCKNTCKDSVENCTQCHLFQFVLTRIMKKGR
jgi:hypothetical protein